MAPVARTVERVVQQPHQLRRFDVGRVLVAEGAPLHTQDEPEALHLLRQIRQAERHHAALVQVPQHKRAEIANQDVAGSLTLLEGIEVVVGLLRRLLQVPPRALLLHQQHTGPEQVDETRAVVQLPHVGLVARYCPTLHPEHREEVVVKTLGFPLLVGGPAPAAGEGGRAAANFVPRQAHQHGCPHPAMLCGSQVVPQRCGVMRCDAM